MLLQPTCRLKWFRTDDNDKDRPTASIRKEYRFDDELWVLKQCWLDEHGSGHEEWRDIECVP